MVEFSKRNIIVALTFVIRKVVELFAAFLSLPTIDVLIWGGRVGGMCPLKCVQNYKKVGHTARDLAPH